MLWKITGGLAVKVMSINCWVYDKVTCKLTAYRPGSAPILVSNKKTTILFPLLTTTGSLNQTTFPELFQVKPTLPKGNFGIQQQDFHRPNTGMSLILFLTVFISWEFSSGYAWHMPVKLLLTTNNWWCYESSRTQTGLPEKQWELTACSSRKKLVRCSGYSSKFYKCNTQNAVPCAGCFLVRIDPIHFMAGCRKMWLNQG